MLLFFDIVKILLPDCYFQSVVMFQVRSVFGHSSLLASVLRTSFKERRGKNPVLGGRGRALERRPLEKGLGGGGFTAGGWDFHVDRIKPSFKKAGRLIEGRDAT